MGEPEVAAALGVPTVAGLAEQGCGAYGVLLHSCALEVEDAEIATRHGNPAGAGALEEGGGAPEIARKAVSLHVSDPHPSARGRVAALAELQVQARWVA